MRQIEWMTSHELQEYIQEMGREKDIQGIGIKKGFTITKTKYEEEEPLTLSFLISTGGRDRDKDIINPLGWKLDEYLKNPVVLWAHDYFSPPVAKSISIGISKEGLESKAVFTSEDIYPFGYMVYRLYKEGFLNGVSVGFIPLKFQEMGKQGIYFEEQELLEYSCVPIPSNPDALIIARKSINLQPLKEWAEKVLEEWDASRKVIFIPKQKVEEVWRILERKVSYDIQKKGAISYQAAHPNGTPKAPEDEEWDAPKEVAEADVSDLKIMCAWVDPENPNIKGSYKLPHHKAKGQHAVVWRGVAAAGAVLMGARGGVDIPEEDIPGVKAHLERHYKEFDRIPPWKKEENEEEVVTKVGRVLSKANEERIRKATLLLQEVLKELEESNTEDTTLSEKNQIEEPDSNSDFDVQTLKEMIKAVVSESIKKLTGKIE